MKAWELLGILLVSLGFLLLAGCSPLAAYSQGIRYGKEPFGKNEIAEAHQRYYDVQRKQAGYPCCERKPMIEQRNFSK